MAAERIVERLDLDLERAADAVDPVIEGGLEPRQALFQSRRDGAAGRIHALVEIVHIGLQRAGNLLGALAHAIDDLAAESLDGAVELGDVPGDQRAQRTAVARELLG